MAVNASVALATARTLCNDDSAQVFTDSMMMPKLVQAFRELASILRNDAASISRAFATGTLTSGTKLLVPASIIEPIRIWERQVGGLDSDYIQMTEYDPLPNEVATTTLKYWQWDGTQINFISCTVNREYKVHYWKSLTEPAGAGSSLVFTDAEIYIAPRTAALSLASLGEQTRYEILSNVAEKSLDLVISANRGRRVQTNPVPETN